jgi:trehalose-6-phosphate synthase
MLGVDRLDMIKGIPQKLLAFEKFLHEHPEWRDKVLLVQVRTSGLAGCCCLCASTLSS